MSSGIKHYTSMRNPKNCPGLYCSLEDLSTLFSMTSLSSLSYLILALSKVYYSPGGGGDTPYNGLYGEVPWLSPERSFFFFRLQVYEWMGISLREVH